MDRWETYQDIPRTRSFHKTKIQERESSSVGENEVFNLQFDLAVGVYNGLHSENMAYFDFLWKKNIPSLEMYLILTNFLHEIKALENCFESFKLFRQSVLLLYNITLQ